MRKFFESYSTTKLAAKGAGTFDFPEFPDSSGYSDSVINLVDGLWIDIDRFVEKAVSIRNDRRFSEVGRREMIDPEVIIVIRSWLDTAARLAAFDASTDVIEKTLIGAPEPHPQNIVAHFRAQEIRDFWRGLPMPAKGEILKALNVDDHRELALAMLQSPLPLNAAEDTAFRETWANVCREANPETTEKIALARKSSAWGDRAMALALVAIRQNTGWTEQHTLDQVLEFTNPARSDAEIMRLGFSRDVIARARLRKQHGR